MMIDLKDVVYIIIGLITIGGVIAGFIVMQTRQNMKIEQLEEKYDKLENKQSKSTNHQIETEKAIISINEKLDHIIKDIEEIKNR